MGVKRHSNIIIHIRIMNQFYPLFILRCFYKQSFRSFISPYIDMAAITHHGSQTNIFLVFFDK